MARCWSEAPRPPGKAIPDTQYVSWHDICIQSNATLDPVSIKDSP